MRILMLTQWFDPEPTFKGLAFAQELTRLGHTVQVITGFPNYPGGRIYDGYRLKLYQRETMDGIDVLRVPLYPSHDKSALCRIANYSTFAFSAAFLGTLLAKQADVMYVYHPPATIGLPAFVISLVRRVPYVYDVQDLWPDTLAATGMLRNRLVLKLIGLWCKLVYRKAGRIAVLSPGFKTALCNRGVPERKIQIIYNWCDEKQLLSIEGDEALARSFGLSGKFNVLFAGNIGKAQALDAVLSAARITAERFPLIQFVLAGGGIEAERLQNKAVDMKLKNVVFLPLQPIHIIGKIMSLADILLVHLKDDPLFKITIPSKTQAYLAVGKPILIGVRGDAAELVAKAEAGISCIPENPESIAEAVQKLYTKPHSCLREMGERGGNFYKHELSMVIGVRRFEQLLNSARKTA